MASILITGGTGTFGRAAAQILANRDDFHRIIIFSRDEQKQDQMRKLFPDDDRLRFFVGDVRDESRLTMAVRDVDIILHAAAMKILPACEYDPIEAVKTNIQGSANVISAALLSANVQQVIAISTDKAASPANLYGATKLAAERLFVAANNITGGHGPKFSVTRYGNVSGSRGSVIPRWRRYVEDGRPLPITHPEMTRFWISVEDAVEFVLNALEVQGGGEVFIPKMPAYRVMDLAAAVYNRDDFPFEITGVRPGEKIHEDLITIHEGQNVVENDHAYAICPPWLRPGQGVDDGFYLTSRNATDRLDRVRLSDLLHTVR